jgi:nicotinamidase-related amidase
MRHALLIVDIQNDYFPGGSMELVGSEPAGQQAAKLVAAFRAKSLPVVHIRHISTRPGATFFLPETPGAEIHPCVAPAKGEAVFTKHFPNSFRDTPLLEHLRANEIGRLTIAGMMTHMCIDTTVRAAFDLGFQCALAHDACATRDLFFGGATIPAAQVHAAYLAGINGLFAKAQSADEICAGLASA